MNKKTIIILLVILVILIIIRFGLQKRELAYETGGGFVSLLPDGFKTDDVAKIEIYRGSSSDDKVTLKNDLGEWKVASAYDYKANKDKMNRLLDDLKVLEGERRTSTDKVFDDFQITDDAGIHLVLIDKDSKQIVHYVLGKQGPNFSDLFVRYDGKKDVYLANKNLRSHIGVYGDDVTKKPENKPWLDLNAFKVDREKVVSVTVHKPDGELVLEKVFEKGEEEKEDEFPFKPEEEKPLKPKEYKWIVLKPEKFEPEKFKAEQIANTLSNIYAVDVVPRDDLEAYGLKEPKNYAILTLEDGTEKKLLFGNKREGEQEEYFFKEADSDDIFVVRKQTFENVFKKEVKDLKPEEKKPEVKKQDEKKLEKSKEKEVVKEKKKPEVKKPNEKLKEKPMEKAEKIVPEKESRKSEDKKSE